MAQDSSLSGFWAGYEVRTFVEHGHDVTAIEFSDAAIEAARRELGAAADRVKKADFFSFATAPYDLVYERAFNDNERGPPFGISQMRLDELLRPFFTLEGSVDIPPADSIPVFKGKERWQAWERKL